MTTNRTDKDIRKDGQNERPEYVPPMIITYTGEEILEEIGPAQACSPAPCPAGN